VKAGIDLNLQQDELAGQIIICGDESSIMIEWRARWSSDSDTMKTAVICTW
jgi:hypothetical protein